MRKLIFLIIALTLISCGGSGGGNDENGNPITKEVPAVKSEGESSASGATEEKKEKKKTKPTEQPVNFDDL